MNGGNYQAAGPWPGLRAAINIQLEETSFRTGLAAGLIALLALGVVAAGTAVITVLPGHGGAVSSAAVRPAAGSPASAVPVPGPSARPSARPPGHRAAAAGASRPAAAAAARPAAPAGEPAATSAPAGPGRGRDRWPSPGGAPHGGYPGGTFPGGRGPGWGGSGGHGPGNGGPGGWPGKGGFRLAGLFLRRAGLAGGR